MATGVPYSRVEVEQVRLLAGDGLSDPQIERETGIPRRRVKGIRRKHGIESLVMLHRNPTYRKPMPPEELAYLGRAVGFRPGYDYARDEQDDPAEAVSVP